MPDAHDKSRHLRHGLSADTATGCRGTARRDLVSIDASYGLGEAVVGGMVTPDKMYVFKRDDGSEVVVRYMGYKDKKIVYDERGGTKLVKVDDVEAYRWALSLAQAEEVARGVRAISRAYGGIIMDTEFCIDQSDRLWFVQALRKPAGTRNSNGIRTPSSCVAWRSRSRPWTRPRSSSMATGPRVARARAWCAFCVPLWN